MPLIEHILLSFIAICATMVVVGSFIENRESYYDRYKISHLTIPKSVFVEKVLNWCCINLSHPKNELPRFLINYKKNKKVNGLYVSAKNELFIYVNNHDSLINFTNTVIHEFIHSRQRNELKHKNNDPFLKLYAKFNSEIGYFKNPFEVEARSLAKKFESKCLKDILKSPGVF
jgi:hypothetical protein